MVYEGHENSEKEQSKGQFLVYQAEDGKLKLDVRFEDESCILQNKKGQSCNVEFPTFATH